MSQQNVKIVTRYLERAREDPDALWSFFDEDVEWDIGGVPSAPDFPRVSRGREAVRDFFRAWAGAFEGWDYEVEDVVGGPDAVVVRIHQWGRGKGSGAEVDSRFWQIWSIRDGKAVRVRHTEDRRSALAAAGLSP